jgi:hypothetical protein
LEINHHYTWLPSPSPEGSTLLATDSQSRGRLFPVACALKRFQSNLKAGNPAFPKAQELVNPHPPLILVSGPASGFSKVL